MQQIENKFSKSNKSVNIARLTIFLFILFFFTGHLLAQVSTLKLNTADNTSYFDITDSGDQSKLRMQADGKLGINQDTPTAGLHMVSNDGLLVQGTYNNGNSWSLGAGTRMHWISGKAAFRVGVVTGTHWDDANVGDYSFATGYNTTASGLHSIAMGWGTIASGHYSTAMGRETTASGDHSTTMGGFTNAHGHFSTAMGYYTTASGSVSTAMGGYVSTNFRSGSFIIGDYSTSIVLNSTTNNQMTMRFAGGYRLFTNSGASVGTQLTGGANSWSTTSDSTKKENFLNADGEYFLNSISALRLGSWNYKGQNPKEFRHYGPMAQEIFSHFGNDGIGTIGCDTLLATADMDGIMMVAIKALGKRTDELKIKNEKLSAKNEMLIGELASQKEEFVSQNKLVQQLLTELTNVKNVVLEIRKENNNASSKMASVIN
ncbi:MAG: tail fiber domain-containing protein [Melioribacteraceae bacterium]|nr:tail fiber domain-containing protein [Melioribacteraceae bacterium]